MCKKCASTQKYRKGKAHARIKFSKQPPAFMVRGKVSFGPGAGHHLPVPPVT